jgi:hypothetical protein
MDISFIKGPDSGEGTTCRQCGRPLTINNGACLQTTSGDACICEDCYREMLVPGSGDAHGNMS